MSKTKKIIIIAVIAVLISAALYFIILHPRIKTYSMITIIYDEFGGNYDIGEPIIEYDHSSVTDESLVMTDFGTFSLGVPSDWENQSKEDSEFTIYRTIGTVAESDGDDGEGMVFNPAGTDNSYIVILNNEELDLSAGELCKAALIDIHGPVSFTEIVECVSVCSEYGISVFTDESGQFRERTLPVDAQYVFSCRRSVNPDVSCNGRSMMLSEGILISFPVFIDDGPFLVDTDG